MARKFTATYQPYTFDELMKPVIMYEKAYDELEKQLDDLDVQRALLNQLDPELDSYAYEKNKAQQDRLMGISEAMSSKGLNPSMRQTIAEMRRYQRNELDPLISAYKQREELIKEQRSKGDNYIFSKDYSTTPLEQMLTGTNTYNAYNLEDALKEGMMSGKAISSRIYSDPVLARELRNQYFRIKEGIQADGRTMDQLFREYPELQEDFDRWYGSSFGDTPIYNQADLDRARERYMLGVSRGLIYDEKLVNNQDHWTPQAWDNKLRQDRAEARGLDQAYGSVISANLGDIHSGDRGQDLGNGVIMIYPKDQNSPSGYGKPYPVDQATGKKLTDEEATSRINRGNFLGVDKATGDKVYNNGRAIIRVDKDTDQIKSITTVTQEGAPNPVNQAGGVNLRTEEGLKKKYSKFKSFNFDWSKENEILFGPDSKNWTGETERGPRKGRHNRSTTTQALSNGYSIMSATDLPESAQTQLKEYIKEVYPDSNVELSDLLILKAPDRDNEEDYSHAHYRVELKPGAYQSMNVNPDWITKTEQWADYEESFNSKNSSSAGSGSKGKSAAELEAELEGILK